MSKNPGQYRSSYSFHNKMELLRGGTEYFNRLIKLIDEARHIIYLHVYIFNEDSTGMEVSRALQKAAQRGVRVNVLVDGYASQALSKAFINQIRSSGVRFRFFEPFFKNRNFYFGRRLHQKVLVADGISAIVSGINIADRYNDMPGEKAWMDWGILGTGEVAYTLLIVCREMWRKLDGESVLPLQLPEMPPGFSQKCAVRVRRNDWARKQNEISASYIEMFRKAQEEITIMSSYFLPGRRLRKELELAAARGVKIRVVLAGSSDVRIVKDAERYIYHWIFKNRIRLFEYQGNVLHGKLSTYDNKWVTVGSYNVNFISAFASVELNLDVADTDFAVEAGHVIDSIIQQECLEIFQQKHLSGYNFMQRLLQKLSYDIIQFIFFLLTFYYRPRKEQ